MNEQVTRQILWNIPAPFIVLMYGLLALLMAGFVYAGLRWYRLVTLGVSENRLDHPFERLLLSLRDSFGQGNVIRETWGWMHYSFYVAFVGLFIGTTIVAHQQRRARPVQSVRPRSSISTTATSISTSKPRWTLSSCC